MTWTGVTYIWNAKFPDDMSPNTAILDDFMFAKYSCRKGLQADGEKISSLFNWTILGFPGLLTPTTNCYELEWVPLFLTWIGVTWVFSNDKNCLMAHILIWNLNMCKETVGVYSNKNGFTWLHERKKAKYPRASKTIFGFIVTSDTSEFCQTVYVLFAQPSAC